MSLHSPLKNYWLPLTSKPHTTTAGVSMGYPLFPSVEHWPIGVNPWLTTALHTPPQGREFHPNFPYTSTLTNSHPAYYGIRDYSEQKRTPKNDSISELRLKAEEHKAAIKLQTKMAAD